MYKAPNQFVNRATTCNYIPHNFLSQQATLPKAQGFQLKFNFTFSGRVNVQMGTI